MVVQSTVELSYDDVLHIREAVYKHHEAFLAVASAGDMYAERVLLSWFQDKGFNIWTIDFNGDTDDYLVEVCPRDYPNDTPSHRDTFIRPSKFDYAYTTIYFKPIEVHRIELPLEYWIFYHSDINNKITYKPGYETWPRFQIYAHEGNIIDVPESLIMDNYE